MRYTWHKGCWSSLGSCGDTASVSPREAGPGRAVKDFCAGVLQKRGRERRMWDSGLCLLMPLDNGRREDSGVFGISSEFSLTIFKDSQMPKSYHRKLIVRNKPKQEHPNAALHLGFCHSKLLSEALKRVRADRASSSLLQPVLCSTARYGSHKQMQCISIPPKTYAGLTQEL